MEVTKLSDFLKQQGDTPQGKSVYQAFIDNFDENYNEKAFGKSERDSIADAFEWAKTNEGEPFWRIVDSKWRDTQNYENDMLWLLDGKEPPSETLEDEVNNIDGKNHLDTILAERGAKYGSFTSQAAFAQYLKTTLHEHRNWDELRDSQKEALEMIMHKISRILNGDPNYDDSWRDIAGYAELIVKELNETTIKG